MRARSWVFVGVALSAGCAAFDAQGPYAPRLDMRGIFETLTYPEAPKEIPAVDHEFQFYAFAQLELLTAYKEPDKVASCLKDLDAEVLKKLGEAVTDTADEKWAERVAGFFEPGDGGPSSAACVNQLPDADRVFLMYSYARYAGSVAAFLRATTDSETERPVRYAAAVKAQQSIAVLLHNSPKHADGGQELSGLPVLALAGGAANGAFTAGFLFELLTARERALNTIAPGEHDAAEKASRFGGLVGTSVGALIAQLLDLYYLDGSALTPAQRVEFKRCVADMPHEVYTPVNSTTCFAGAPTPTYPGYGLVQEIAQNEARLPQACALKTLLREFAFNNEQRLLCVDKVPVTALVGVFAGAVPGFARFDPTTHYIIDPVLANHGVAMNKNDVVRTTVSVEIMQNQAIGLDERACTPLPPESDGGIVDTKNGYFVRHGKTGDGTREYCLSSGTMASTVLPLFARPLRHAYSGMTKGGECGAWLDGGLRNGFPAYRALRLSRPDARDKHLRVLAIETSRFDGVPSPRPYTVVDVGLNAITQMARQIASSEAGEAQRFAEKRRREFSALCHVLELAGRVEECGPDQAVLMLGPPEVNESLVIPVFVPSTAPDELIAETGYSFDTYVMQGLFTWGRQVAIDRLLEEKKPLGERLRWTALEDGLKKAAQEDEGEGDFKKWLAAYRLPKECKPHYEARMKQGRQRVLENMEYCGALPAGKETTSPDAPDFFACQPGAHQWR